MLSFMNTKSREFCRKVNVILYKQNRTEYNRIFILSMHLNNMHDILMLDRGMYKSAVWPSNSESLTMWPHLILLMSFRWRQLMCVWSDWVASLSTDVIIYRVKHI